MTELRVFDSLAALRQVLQQARQGGLRIALVPTMGNLHAGHLALVQAARASADFVVATIFVNPLQFGPNEDYARYPRTLDQDLAALRSAACAAVFVPTVAEMYPEGFSGHTSIHVPELATLHCGASRPGHFDGVCTVVAKLFNMLQPDLAVFGLKDYQQFRIIGRMASDLHFPLRLLGVETVRDARGLAISSRNSYLDKEENNRAPVLYATLQALASKLREGQRDFAALASAAASTLQEAGLRPDYVHICKLQDLQLAGPGDEDLVILAAAYAGSTRLIDNVRV